MDDWGVLDSDGQWIAWRVPEETARGIYDGTPEAWALCSDIRPDFESGSESHTRRAERPENKGF